MKIGYNNVSEILKRIRNYETQPNSKVVIDLTVRELQFLGLVCDENEYTYEQMAEINKKNRKIKTGSRIGTCLVIAGFFFQFLATFCDWVIPMGFVGLNK